MPFDLDSELELQTRSCTTQPSNRRLIHSARLLFDVLISMVKKHGTQTVVIKDRFAAQLAHCEVCDLGSVQLRLQEAGIIEVQRTVTATSYKLMVRVNGLSYWNQTDLAVNPMNQI